MNLIAKGNIWHINIVIIMKYMFLIIGKINVHSHFAVPFFYDCEENDFMYVGCNLKVPNQ